MASSNTLPFNDEVAVITGASSGIGRGAAVKLAQKGVVKFCLTGRNQSELEQTRKLRMEQSANSLTEESFVLVAGKLEFKEKFHKTLKYADRWFTGDIAEESVCKKIVNETIAKLGKIDILFNNAGISATGTIENLNLDTFDKLFDVNLKSTMRLTRMIIPHLKTSKRAVINCSSVCGARACNYLAY